MKDKRQKRKKKEHKLSLFGILIMLSLVPIILSMTIISAMSFRIVKRNLEEDERDTLYIAASNLANYCYENEINAINASNYYEYLDSLKDRNIEMAIIIEGTPSATSIKNENEYRIREIPCEERFLLDHEGSEKGYYVQDVVIDDKIYYAYYMPIRSEGGIIGAAFAGELQENVTGATKKIIENFLIITVSLIAVFSMITLLCSRRLIKAFQMAGKRVNALSQGDLRKQDENKSIVREMDTLLAETAIMQENLLKVMGTVKEVSITLVEKIGETAKLSESSSDKARQITASVSELSTSSANMTGHVQEIQNQMLEIGNCVNDISENIEHLLQGSEEITQVNNAAKAAMDIILDNNQKSVNAVNDISIQIKATNDSIAEIDKAVELILNISGQTKLLSLNASIEAARAGEHGKGFAVVAEEIRNLSEQSAEGAEMIKKLASSITEKSRKSVRSTEVVCELIKEGQKSVSDTQAKYEDLSIHLDQSVSEIQFIAEKKDNLADYKERVIENVQDLSAISTENASSNDEVRVNINNIMSEIQLVNENCEGIDKIAGELDHLVSYFKLDCRENIVQEEVCTDNGE